MLKYNAFILILCALLCTGFAQAASVQVTNSADGKPRVVMANDLLTLQLNPQRGGRVDSFRYMRWGDKEIINDRPQGLLNDHFWQEYWPGQFWEAQYTYTIITAGPEEVSVKLSCLSKDKGVPQVAGILLEKTITLHEHDRVVHVTIRLTNTTREGKYVGYWLQNVCWLAGNQHGNQYFRPAKRGISMISSDDANPADNGFVREPQAGWSAAIDGASKTGLVFLMDYNNLWFLYNCTPANTIEWQYDAVAIPPGKSWETAVSIIPTSDMDTVSFANARLLAGLTCRETAAAGQLDCSAAFQAVDGELPALEADASLETLLTHQAPPSAPVQRLDHLGTMTRSISFSLPYDARKREPAVVRLTLHGSDAYGKPLDATPEFWYAGNALSNTNPTDGSPLYAIPSVPKVKSVIKPDVIARIKSPTPQVLFLKGFLSSSYQLDTLLPGIKPTVTVKEGYAYNGVFGPQLDYFPYDYNTLMAFDLVILGDLSSGYLGDVALEMLKDYCRHGGNLLVLGGPFAFGNGGYRGSVLDELLPVICRQPFDLQPAHGKVIASAPLDGIAGLSRLHFAYIHAVTVKPGASVLLRCGNLPLLVAGKYGEGQVLCSTGAPLGAHNPFATPQWREVLARLLPLYGGFQVSGFGFKGGKNGSNGKNEKDGN